MYFLKCASCFTALALMPCLAMASAPVAAQARSDRPQVWFAPNDDLPRARFPGGFANHDFPHLFDPNPAWDAKIDVFKISPMMGSTVGPAEESDRHGQPSRSAVPSVWFAPDSETPDLVEMFRRPELWAESRSHISVFKFGPLQVRSTGKPPVNSVDDLARVGAFQKLGTWGIDIAIEAPSIKPWDCTAVHARQMTADYIRSVKVAGGKVRFIAMDEPMASGLVQCHDSVDAALDKTVDYIKQLSADPDLAAQGLTPEVGDIEAYPSQGVAGIERWVEGLERRGAKPRFFHLDINVHRLDVDHTIDAQRDLRELARFFRANHIPFGVILWPGYNPVASDRVFHDLTLSWTRRVHQAIGQPDQVIVQSWVVRGGAACSLTDPKCDMLHPHCAPTDGPNCGKHSVPQNLPDSDPSAFSLTQTMLDALRVLQ